ncbi:MAG TPA: chromate transporter [Longimicrobiaceae bacterium]|nr:chromate transporter [Longimicrobiaceae bacterium]
MTPDLRRLVRYFLRLGATGFGGPIVLVEHMRRDLVDEHGWISAEEYRDGLALSQLAPGPLAAQLAIYLGWVRGGTRGATLVGLAFVAPSLVMVLALSALYVRLGGIPWMVSAFYGVGAAVIAIIARSAFVLARRTLGRDRLLWGIFAVNGVVTAWTASELLWVLLASGVAVMVVRGHHPRIPLRTVAPALALPVGLLGVGSTLHAQLFFFFAKASLVVFGSGLAVVPFLYGGVVETHHWLDDRQFLDSVAVSMLTPGPVVITVAFIGYLVAGPGGAAVAALGMFLPVYLAVVLAAPYYHRIRERAYIRAFVEGVTAAAAGALAGATVVLAQRAIVDLPAVLIALVAFALLDRRLKVPEPALILAAGVAGVLLKA